MFKKSVKLSLATVLAVGTLFTGCGEDTKEADQYNVELWLDSGDNDKVINYLGDCSSYSGDKIDCYLNLGAAYFGKAKFDMISLTKEFSDIDENLDGSAKSKAFNKIIFKKLDDPSLQIGIDYYSKVVNEDTSKCNAKDYDSLSNIEKQACLSINPVLISDMTSDTKDKDKSANAISLAEIIAFKNVFQDAVPELQSEDLVTIMDGGILSVEKDVNQNNKLDSVEASNYALNVFAFGKVWDGNTTVSSDFNRTVSYTNAALKDKTIKLAKMTIQPVAPATSSKQFYKLIEYGADFNTTLTTIPNMVCDNNNEVLKDKSLSNITNTSANSYLPCVKIKNNKVSSLNDSVVNILNDDSLLTSIALSSKSSDDSKTDDVKVSEFKNNICDINGTASSSNQGKCEVDANGKITITQDALVNYMNKDK